MTQRSYGIDLTKCHKVIVGEGESDRNFFGAFCVANAITGFDYAFTGMHSTTLDPSGFSEFVRYLPALESQAGFANVTDVVLACDSGENPQQKLTQLQRQIRDANIAIGRAAFTETPAANVIATIGTPRVHVLMIPSGAPGGLETVCFDVARARQNLNGDNKGTVIEGWVNIFANSACVNWTTEKRDKLRLQAFLSAAFDSKPDIHFAQLFGLTRDRFIPLLGPAFNDIRNFLTQVSAL